MRSRKARRGRFGSGAPFRSGVVIAVGALLVLWSGRPALADHSLGQACLTTCHSLRSGAVIAGSRNMPVDLYAFPLYNNYWYCATRFEGGDPLDCSYCHGTSDDVGAEFGRRNGGLGMGSSHPVDVQGPTQSYGANRVFCNDCHDATVGPADKCTKTDTDGYPNHIGIASKEPTGKNKRSTAAATHLVESYGFDVDWTQPLDRDNMLCFRCHDGTVSGVANIKAEYDQKGGGHNVPYQNLDGTTLDTGKFGTGKMPCFYCHDPHASTSAATYPNNLKLILNWEVRPDNPNVPYDPSSKTFFTAEDFTGDNDRVVCFGCHDPAATGGPFTVKPAGAASAVSPPGIQRADLVFTFHESETTWVHEEVVSGGNCLRKNGGCHQSAHQTDIFRCLDCHTTTPPGSNPPTENSRLAKFKNVDSEFGHIGYVRGNRIQSVHSIPYRDQDTTADMSLRQNNGCLQCHYALKPSPTNQDYFMLKDPDGNGYARNPISGDTGDRGAMLEPWDRFCLSCHDGENHGDKGQFVSGAYTLSDPAGGTISFPAATLLGPKVNNPGASWDTGYYFGSGHGAGLHSSATQSTYSPSGNRVAKVPCLECHLYHGSTAYKLLPGWREATDGAAHVVKGKSYSPQTTGTALGVGGVSTTEVLDYVDYTRNGSGGNSRLSADFHADYCSDYRNSAAWTTMESSTGVTDTPICVETRFGTTGDLLPNNPASLDGNVTVVTSSHVGFCNVCHFYDNASNGSADPTAAEKGTLGLAYTHEGYYLSPPSTALDADGAPLKSKRNFFNDCCECHDPHGSGKGGPGDTDDNVYMIRKRLKHGNTSADWSAVVFQAVTGSTSFDPADANTDDICTVCHIGTTTYPTWGPVGHNRRDGTFPGLTQDHYLGQNCTGCHPHGLK